MTNDSRLDDPRVFPHLDVLGDVRVARSREWVVGNGTGAYASSTIACLHTRRYHGLLVAALDPPRSRHVTLSHVDVTVTVPAKPGTPRSIWDLAKHQFPNIDPDRGSFHLQRFDQDPLPRWTYAVAGGELEVLLALVPGENAVVLRYSFRGPQPVVCTLRPLLAMRHINEVMREHGAAEQRVELRAGEMRVRPMRALPRLCFKFEGTFVGSPDWWRRFEFFEERARGMEFHEDLWTPGVFEIRPDPSGVPNYLVVGVDKAPEGNPEALVAAAIKAVLDADPGPEHSALERRLSLSTRLFRADLLEKPAVVPAFPWIDTWGREAIMALPGLYFALGHVDQAMNVVRTMIASMQDGLLPTRMPDQGAVFDTAGADTTLWLFELARQFADHLGETHPFVQGELFPVLVNVFELILRGAPHDIHITPDGLLAAGRPGDSLTWMDARSHNKVVTSRAGCPVELTALWAAACRTLARIADAQDLAPLAGRADKACARARNAFHARFWCENTAYPYDVISESTSGESVFRDATIRPNAVLALAIDPLCFSPERARLTLERARKELVTAGGLRTLAPHEPGYVGHCEGSVDERYASHHQGSVFPWLIGPYARAARAVLPPNDPLVTELPTLIASAADRELAVGHIPQVAHGNDPQKLSGCVAHALGVAELLRALKG
ncbi:MAG TPA: amylo-alpha-1,6-glucosidase [Polyangium sp.]|nr:amylo-alpha-1,6-glucosidase [Polyangium sp.]